MKLTLGTWDRTAVAPSTVAVPVPRGRFEARRKRVCLALSAALAWTGLNVAPANAVTHGVLDGIARAIDDAVFVVSLVGIRIDALLGVRQQFDLHRGEDLGAMSLEALIARLQDEVAARR